MKLTGGGRKSAELDRFFSNKTHQPQRLNLGGKRLCLASFPSELKERAMERLAEKDPVMAKSLKEGTFGIKIDGIEVNRDNIKQFEIGAKKAKEIKSEEEPKVESKKFTEKALFKLNKAEQVEMLKALGVKKVPRFERSRVKKILELQ